MNALIRFLAALRTLAVMKNGGEENDLSKLLQWAHLGARAGNNGKQHLEAAAAKVEQLVREDRGLNEIERKDLDERVRGKLARAAGVVVVPPAAPADPTEATDSPTPPDGPADAPAGDSVSFPGS